MSEQKQFDCPSCFAPIVFKGGESLFQTCESCMAPVIVPSEIYYEKGAVLASEDFASLKNDKDVDVDQVTNELTPGESLPDSSIAEGLGLDVVIEKFDVFQEKIGTGSVAEKKAFDEITGPGGDGIPDKNPLLESKPNEAFSAVFDLIRSELNAGDKVAAIKVFRDAFGGDVSAAKDAVEAIDRGEELELDTLQEV